MWFIILQVPDNVRSSGENMHRSRTNPTIVFMRIIYLFYFSSFRYNLNTLDATAKLKTKATRETLAKTEATTLLNI